MIPSLTSFKCRSSVFSLPMFSEFGKCLEREKSRVLDATQVSHL